MQKTGIVLLAAIVASCARVMPPSGGERDTEPPRVVETFPAQNADASNLAGTTTPVRIVFHETLSERSPRELVQVSPESGAVEAERDGKEIRVTMRGGWQRGKVYRVSVLPGIVDRHANARTTAYELVFTTGGVIVPNALGGLVTDRITGKPVVNARVEAITGSDSTIYTTVTDTGGFFALRSLPPGLYTARVYSDQNRNRKLDPVEARALREVPLGANDTIAIELQLLARDTTPARLVRADVRDSLQVRLIFDDYMEQAASISGIRVTAWQLPDSTAAITGGSIMTARAFQRLTADSARTPPGLAARPGAVVPDTASRLLPINELVWVPTSPLRPSTRYRISVAGFRNLQGIADGGGSIVVTTPAPPRTPPPAARDSVRQ